MRRVGRWLVVALGVVGAWPVHSDEAKPAGKKFGDVTEARVLDETAAAANWFVNGGRYSGEHFSPLTQINAQNVSELGLAWVTDLPSPTGLVAEPLVVDGIVYLPGNLHVVYALDARTGELLWQFDPKVRLDVSLGSSEFARWSRGIAVWDGAVYLGSSDCRLIAIDAARGTKLWEVPVCDSSEAMGAGITAAPRVGGGKVFTGYAGSDMGVRGSLVAFDAKTGEELWRFWTVPGEPSRGFESKAMEIAAKSWVRDGWAKTGGGVVWEGIRYDPETGQVIFGTASAAPINTSLRGPGDHLFTNSVLAVDADTGEYRWHYQTVPADAWDYDANNPKIVTELEIDGKRRRVVLETPKNGFFYVLDAKTGELLAADPFVKTSWASHVDLETGRPVELPGARYYEGENPEASVRVSPSAAGARNWQTMSYSPQTGLVYMPVTEMPAEFSAGGFFGARTEVLGYGPEEEVPIGAGRLVAWDPAQRQIRWAVDYPYPFNGGVLSTAGDLVFQGTATGELRAYKADTGQLLWGRELGSSVNANPVSYALDGEQYILLPIGAGGGMGINMSIRSTAPHARGPARLLAFKLGGQQPLPTQTLNPPIPQPPARIGSAEEIQRGADVWLDAGCMLCHGAHAIGVFERKRDGAIPDLRYSPASVHAEWHAIVLGGSRRPLGMPAFSDLSLEDSSALRAYVIDQAWKAFEAEKTASPH